MKLKCIKCGIRFKDREDQEEKSTVYVELCFQCMIIWKMFEGFMKALGMSERNNRDVIVRLEDIVIRKKPVRHRNL